MNDLVTALKLQARTAATYSDVFENSHNFGMIANYYASAMTAGASIVITIQSVDPIAYASGAVTTSDDTGTKDVLASAAIVAAGAATPLIVCPGCIAVGNSVVNQPAPRLWRIKYVPADGKSVTNSVAVAMVG